MWSYRASPRGAPIQVAELLTCKLRAPVSIPRNEILRLPISNPRPGNWHNITDTFNWWRQTQHPSIPGGQTKSHLMTKKNIEEFVDILIHHNTEKQVRCSHASQGLASPMFPPPLLLTPAKFLLVPVRWECPYIYIDGMRNKRVKTALSCRFTIQKSISP